MALRVMTLLVLAWCLLAAPARALDPVKDFRHYVRDNWSVPEGLPQISALSIAQTPDGYIWAGTQAGLSRFDGVGFTTFTPSMEPALRHLFVRALAVDPDGALWIGTYAGLAVYRDGRFEEVPWTGAGDAPLVSTIRIAIGHAPFDIGDGRSVKVTASVGLSEYPLFRDKGAPLGWEAMVELADQALYHVKRNGRDGWALFRPTPTTQMETLMADLQRDLARLLRDGGLELVGNVGTGAGSARR